VARWLTGWGDSYHAANRILANSGGNTFHWSGASSWVALALVIVPFALVGAGCICGIDAGKQELDRPATARI
jgi:hypothetical protein